jgi:hypothetical protein
LRQIYRWYIASKQDVNPIIKLLHANYAVGWIDSLRSIASDGEIWIESGLDINQINKKATAEQDKAMLMLSKMCPEIIPSETKQVLTLLA